MRLVTTSLVLAGLALGAPVPALAAEGAPALVETFEGYAEGEPGFRRFVALGRSGPWLGEIRDGAYVLSNREEASAVKYFYVEQVPGMTEAGLRRAIVEVEVGGDYAGERAAAGLIYGLDPARGVYLLFTLLGTDEYALFGRALDGFHTLARGTNPAIRAEGPNRLGIRPRAERVELLVNGETIGAFALQGQELPGRATGIAALGTGEFRFDNFKITAGDG